MKHLKILGLAAIAAMALMAFGASSASATTLTSPTGTTLPAGTEIVSTASSSLLLNAGFANVTCTESTVAGKTSNAGSSTETVKGPIETLTFSNCPGWTVDVLKKGSLEIHTDTTVSDENGTLTSSGAEVTVKNIETGIECVYSTNNTDIGTLKGGSPATLAIAASLTKVSGSFLCAPSAEWSGSYTVTVPSSLYVD